MRAVANAEAEVRSWPSQSRWLRGEPASEKRQRTHSLACQMSNDSHPYGDVVVLLREKNASFAEFTDCTQVRGWRLSSEMHRRSDGAVRRRALGPLSDRFPGSGRFFCRHPRVVRHTPSHRRRRLTRATDRNLPPAHFRDDHAFRPVLRHPRARPRHPRPPDSRGQVLRRSARRRSPPRRARGRPPRPFLRRRRRPGTSFSPPPRRDGQYRRRVSSPIGRAPATIRHRADSPSA